MSTRLATEKSEVSLSSLLLSFSRLAPPSTHVLWLERSVHNAQLNRAQLPRSRQEHLPPTVGCRHPYIILAFEEETSSDIDTSCTKWSYLCAIQQQKRRLEVHEANLLGKSCLATGGATILRVSKYNVSARRPNACALYGRMKS